ncbi:AfsR/SARP family transcriptional regulator [Atopobium fossor]|uniref:AfsR/SARP family transcriptional regulator n=1 Tax=Atopobium fossor TaxID=39487 RepID=UPI00041E8129|nr:hypothetical protein [Atopobium fossor]
MRRRPLATRAEHRGAYVSEKINISECLNSVQILEGIHIGQSKFTSPVVVFLAEPSCDCDTYAHQLLCVWNAKGHPTYEINCLELSKDDLLSQIRHYCNEVESGNEIQPLIVIKDLMPCDETLAKRLGKLISRLSEYHYNFVITVAPEASQAISHINNPAIIHGSDLVINRSCLGSFLSFASHSQLESLFACTCGVPQLMRPSLEYLSHHVHQNLPAESIYCLRDATKKFVRDGFRESLITDDKNMRLAMFLLGSGTVEDLDKVIGRPCGDLFATLCDASPFYNASIVNKTFCCAYLSSHKALDGIRHELSLQAELEPQITRRCIEILLEHGKYVRAAKVACLFFDEKTWLDVAMSWPLELINSGEGQIIRKAVQKSSDSLYVFEKSCAQVALYAIDGQYEIAQQAFTQVPIPLGSRQTEMYYQLIWMLEALKPISVFNNGVLDKQSEESESASSTPMARQHSLDGVREFCNLPPKLAMDGTYGLAHEFYVHWRVKNYLLCGDIKKAFAELLLQGVPSKISSLTDALLAIDFAMVQRFASDHVLSAGFILQERVEEFMNQTEYAFLSDRLKAFCLGLDALAGALNQLSELERLVNKMVAANLLVESSVLLICASMQSMYEGSRLQAYVLIERAKKLLSGADPFLILKHINHLKKALDVCMNSGDIDDEKMLESVGLANHVNALNMAETELLAEENCAEWLLAKAYLGEKSKLVIAANRLKKYELPEIMVPLMAVLVKTCGKLSQTLADAMPTAWKNKIDRFGIDRRDMLEKHKSDILLADIKPHELNIRVLGELSVYIDDIPIAETSWKRHMAKNLIALLAVTPGHALTRFQLTSALWPDCSYNQARDRLYVTLTAARRALSVEGGGCPFIRTGNGRVWLAPDCVKVDVDEFIHACQKVFSAEYSNKRVLQEVIRVSALYTGAVSALDDALGITLAARQDTSKRFIDLCLLGARAALTEDELSHAEWLADMAYRTDDLREDVLKVLLEVYVAQSRMVDAKALFTKYARRLSEVTGLSPSRELKRLLQSMYKDLGVEGSADEPDKGSHDTRSNGILGACKNDQQDKKGKKDKKGKTPRKAAS